MAEASNGPVTITLGRTGQVVNRVATVSDVSYADSLPSAGSKRSVRDRLGSNLDSFLSRGSLPNNKRQRGDGYTSLSGNGVDGETRIGKDDLRFKLMHKHVSRRAQSNFDQKAVDLHEKLSRTVRPPDIQYGRTDTRQHMPDAKRTSILGSIPPRRSAEVLPQMDLTRNFYSPWTLDHIRRSSPDRI